MPYLREGQRPNKTYPIVNLVSFLGHIQEPYDLLQLLNHPLLINPSDMFAIVDCETRLRGYSGDRTVCAVMFLLDLHQEVTFRLDSSEFERELDQCFGTIVCATIEHYHRPDPQRAVLVEGLLSLEALGFRELILESFERRFRDWRQMMRTARRSKQSALPEDSIEYGILSRGAIVADRIGNMLSHIRHIFCDRAFPNDHFSLE